MRRFVFTLIALSLSVAAFAQPPDADLRVDAVRLSPDLWNSGVSVLPDGGYMGGDIANLGDVDGDGVEDIVVNIGRSDVGGDQTGALLIVYPDRDGRVRHFKRLDAKRGGVSQAAACDSCRFTHGVSVLDDIDGDGNPEIVVGSMWDPGGGIQRGAVWIFYLDEHQNVRSEAKIQGGLNGMPDDLADTEFFGYSVEAIGDLDGDGVEDIAVGAINDDGPDNHLMNSSGAVWILFLNPDGTVHASQRINAIEGAGPGADPLPLRAGHLFGECFARLGDLDGDGIEDLAVGAVRDRGGGIGDCGDGTDLCFRRGAIYIFLMQRDGRYRRFFRITDDHRSGFEVDFADYQHFGREIEAFELAHNGKVTIAVGQSEPDDIGSMWVLDLDFSREPRLVVGQQKIGYQVGGFPDALKAVDQFGFGITTVHNGAAGVELYVGAQAFDDGGTNRGAMWRLLLESSHRVVESRKASSVTGDFDAPLFHEGDQLGSSLALDPHSGILAIGAIGHEELEQDSGAVLLVDDVEVPRMRRLINERDVGLSAGDHFGSALAWDPNPDDPDLPRLFVGAAAADPRGSATDGGLVYVIEVERATLEPVSIGTVPAPTNLQSGAAYGSALAVTEDSDGSRALWVGAPGGDGVYVHTPLGTQPWTSTSGSVARELLGSGYGRSVAPAPSFSGVLFGRADFQAVDEGRPKRGVLTVWGERAATPTESYALSAELGDEIGIASTEMESFGSALVGLGRLTGFSGRTVAVGAPGDPTTDTGKAIVIPLEGAARPTWTKVIAPGLRVGDRFGAAITALRGSEEDRRILVGAPGDDLQGHNVGQVWQVELRPQVRTAPIAQGWLAPPTPNPASGTISLRYSQSRDGVSWFQIFDSRGRRIRTIEAPYRPSGDQILSWNGRDDQGRRVPSGVYHLRGRNPKGVFETRSVAIYK